MSSLAKTIRRLVDEDRYLVSEHAAERLDERGIMEWQVVAGLADGVLLGEVLDAIPYPAIEVREELPDGTQIVAVWSYLPHSGVAKLVTAYFPDR